MSDEKLKPCPFCGQAAQVLSRYDGIGWQVGCNNTLCPMCPHVSIWDKGYAITEWNTRATDPVTERLAKALEDLIERMECWSVGTDIPVDLDAANDALAAYRAQQLEEKRKETRNDVHEGS